MCTCTSLGCERSSCRGSAADSRRRNDGGDGCAPCGVTGGSSIVVRSVSAKSQSITSSGSFAHQVAYAVDFSQYGIPGLSYRIAYVRGHDIDVGTTTDGKEHELFNQLSYKVQSGPAKDLNVRLRASTLRVSDNARAYNTSGNEVRIFLDYPFSVF